MTPSPHNQTIDGPITILYVEDNPGDVRLTQEAFKTTDYESTFHIATDGNEAIDFLTQQVTGDALPDIVLLDLNLPGLDGCDVLDTIRDDPQLKRLPVLMLTSSEAEEDVARCYKASANAYITKPSGPDEFASMVQSIEEFWFEWVHLPPMPS